MAIMPFSATTGVAASRFFPDALPRTLQTWSEELNRAFAAFRRYEQLRIEPAADPPLGDRASKARQVFTEMYADKSQN